MIIQNIQGQLFLYAGPKFNQNETWRKTHKVLTDLGFEQTAIGEAGRNKRYTANIELDQEPHKSYEINLAQFNHPDFIRINFSLKVPDTMQGLRVLFTPSGEIDEFNEVSTFLLDVQETLEEKVQ